MKEIDYYNFLRIYVADELVYDGEVFIYKDNSCEGIMIDKFKDEHYLHGTFEKFVYLDLVIDLKDGDKVLLNATKAFLKYDGDITYVIGNAQYRAPFYLTASTLDQDPREFSGGENPRNSFIAKLSEFKEKNNLNDEDTTIRKH